VVIMNTLIGDELVAELAHLESAGAMMQTVRYPTLLSLITWTPRAHSVGGGMRPRSWRQVCTAAVQTIVLLACSGDNGTGPGSKVPAIGVVSALGDVKVTTQTSGIDLDTDGYVIQVDSPWDYELEPTKIAANGTVDLRGLSATSHVLTLLGVAVNCTGEQLVDRPITVAANTETAVVFQLDCK
jgi:hypothetical protein